MKYKIFLLISGGLLLVSAVQAGESSPSQMERSGIRVAWKKTFGGSGNDWGNSVSQTSDGGYIIIGRTESYGAGAGDAWLIKTNGAGNEEWSKTFGGKGSDSGYSLSLTSDGGYIITGETRSYGAGNYNAWLIKTNGAGNEEWSKTFGGRNSDRGRSVSQTSDGGYIMTGWTTSYGAGATDAWLIKTDRAGNEEWSKTFGGSNFDYGYFVSQTSDGGYIITGRTESYGAGGSDAWLIKTDGAGNEEWSKTFGGKGSDRGDSVSQTSDGGYIIIGRTKSYGAGVGDAWLIKTDGAGNEEWSKTFGGSEFDRGYSVFQTSDGGYIITGETRSYGAGNYNAWLIKTDKAGNEEWSETFGGDNNDRGRSVSQTSDGGYIITGETESYGAGGNDVWLIRLTISPVYISRVGVQLKSVTGKVITTLPIGTQVLAKEKRKDYVLVRMAGGTEGWVKREDISFIKPDIMKPVIRILSKRFTGIDLYLKGVVYDDIEVKSVEFGGHEISRADFPVDKGNFNDVYPFEEKIALHPGMEFKLKAKDTSGRLTELLVDIKEAIISYTPAYTVLKATTKANIREAPNTGSKILGEIQAGGEVVSIGYKGKWFCLEGGTWVHKSVVKEVAKPVMKAEELVVKATEKKLPKIIQAIDVDVNIPKGSTKNPDGVAVVIGVRDYKSRDIPPVEYALRDAGVMREYLIKLLGYKKENIIYVENPTYAELREVFGSETNYKGKLYRWVKKDKSDIFIYYAGHGAPDIESKEPYLVPVDCNPQSVALNGYPLALLYQNLAKIPARSQTIVIDACFSGGSDKGMIIKRASPLGIRPGEAEKLPPDSIVLTSSSGNEISSWYPEKRHSLFTYYFLKGLGGAADKTKDGVLTFQELKNYLDEKVPYYAGRLYNREQHPEYKGKLDTIIVRYK